MREFVLDPALATVLFAVCVMAGYGVYCYLKERQKKRKGKTKAKTDQLIDLAEFMKNTLVDIEGELENANKHLAHITGFLFGSAEKTQYESLGLAKRLEAIQDELFDQKIMLSKFLKNMEEKSKKNK